MSILRKLFHRGEIENKALYKILKDHDERITALEGNSSSSSTDSSSDESSDEETTP